LKLRDKAEKETGEKKIYMPNVTAETDEMLKRARFVKKHGGEYVMVDILTLGFSALETLRKANLGLVLHAHRAMHAALTRSERHGISMLVIAKIARLIGIDQLHIGTAYVGKMSGSAKEVIDIENAIEQRYFGIKPVFAVASGGLHPGHVPKLMQRMGTDIIMQFGGGVHGHPDGTRAGATAVRQAVEAVMKKISIKQYSKTHKELAGAIEKWGC
ncbi:MAG: ribulose-bisphosphate carboxylase large subunit, partial [Candidatus Aenigmarchaeota archaeon]|nr:ribulose-bisphosphate carboxylase large subunit [Candidatus Aenigmarchaeota archaeon]